MRLAVLALALALGAPALAGCLQQANDALTASLVPVPEGPPLDADGFVAKIVEGYVYSTFDATTDAGFTVHAEVYLPDASNATPGALVPDTFPAILLASPYNGAGYGPDVEFGYDPYDFLVDVMLPRGYAIVVGDSAAMGGSGGCWDFMGPADVASAVALVEGIAQQPWSNGKVGMMGLSYDAMTQIMASTAVAEHLVTIVPAAPLTSAYSGLYMNGVHYGGGWWATTTIYTQSALAPPGDNADRYPGHVDSVAKSPPCVVEATAHGNDPSGAFNAYYQARDFRPLAADVAASVFYIQGFLDSAVKPDNLLPFYEDLTAPKKAWLGHWHHQYPNAQNAGRADLYTTLHRWFDHWLYGAQNGIDEELRVDVQDSLGGWRHEESWPPADASAMTLALNADGTLAPDAGEPGALAFGGPASLLGPAGQRLGVATLDGAPLDAPLRIAGQPLVNLTLASDRPGGIVVVNLWDVADDGTPRRISRGAFNLMLAEDMTTASPLSPGDAVNVAFHLYPTDHVVEAGHALRLTLETTDATQWFTADPWLSTLTLATGAEGGSTLTLPVIERAADAVFLVSCGAPLATYADCHDEDLEDEGLDGKEARA